MSNNLRPLGDRIAIEPLEQAEKTAGGIFLPDTAKEKSQEGRVVAVGPGRTLDNGTVLKTTLKVGDVVLYQKYAGSEMKQDGKDIVIVSEKDVLAVIDGRVLASV